MNIETGCFGTEQERMFDDILLCSPNLVMWIFVHSLYFQCSDQILVALENLASTAVPELMRADKNNASVTFPTLTRWSIHHLFRICKCVKFCLIYLAMLFFVKEVTDIILCTGLLFIGIESKMLHYWLLLIEHVYI